MERKECVPKESIPWYPTVDENIAELSEKLNFDIVNVTIETKPWHGIPRERIHWNPTVNENICIGCRTCITGCSRLVYRYDFGKNKAVVYDPLKKEELKASVESYLNNYEYIVDSKIKAGPKNLILYLKPASDNDKLKDFIPG